MVKFGLLAWAAVCLLGCASVPKAASLRDRAPVDPGVKIVKVYWVIHNIPRGFYRNFHPETSCFATFSIEYAGDLKEGSIVGAGLNNGQLLSQNFTLEDNVDYRDHIIGTKYITKGNDLVPFSGNTFPIGLTSFWFETDDAALHTMNLELSEPGKLNAGGKNLVYTETAGEGPDSELAQLESLTYLKLSLISALKRPTVLEGKLDAGTLRVTFREDDRRAQYFAVYLYDQDQRKVARAPMRPFSPAGGVRPGVDPGQAWSVDGTPNRLEFAMTDLELVPGRRLDEAVGFYLTVTDGAQYLPRPDVYDYASYSERFAFPDAPAAPTLP